MRLIDADAFGIGKANPDVFKEKAYAHGWNSAVEIIESAPTVDAVPVVRCKDCKYRGKIFCPMIHETMGNGLVDYTKDMNFCCYGEKRDDSTID